MRDKILRAKQVRNRPLRVAPERVASTVSRYAAIREPGVVSETERISMYRMLAALCFAGDLSQRRFPE